HIAKIPLPPHKKIKDVPEVLSQLVLKMMAKTAEDRYQSLFGLKADLQKILQQLQMQDHVSLFPLASQDTATHFAIPEKLYGRENEIQQLLAAFTQINLGNTQLLLVTGEPGVGKTRFIH